MFVKTGPHYVTLEDSELYGGHAGLELTERLLFLPPFAGMWLCHQSLLIATFPRSDYNKGLGVCGRPAEGLVARGKPGKARAHLGRTPEPTPRRTRPFAVTWSPRQPIGAQPCPHGQWAGGAVLPAAISARGRWQAKAARGGGGMLRAAEPGAARGEAGGRGPWAAPPTQSKRLTSFLIQDILRDRAERRGGHAGSPQHQRQRHPDPRRNPELEPEEAGGPGALGDPPSIRPAETPAQPESGKPNRPGDGHASRERIDDCPELWMWGSMATGRTSPSWALNYLGPQPRGQLTTLPSP